MKASRGFTLVETMLAGSILLISTLAMFEGITLATRISRENAELLQAEGVAWDAVWTVFNEDYERLIDECNSKSGGVSVRSVTLSDDVAPILARYDMAPTLSVTLTKVAVTIDSATKNFVSVEGDVTWGPRLKRRSLSSMQRTFVWRGPMSRVETF